MSILRSNCHFFVFILLLITLVDGCKSEGPEKVKRKGVSDQELVDLISQYKVLTYKNGVLKKYIHYKRGFEMDFCSEYWPDGKLKKLYRHHGNGLEEYKHFFECGSLSSHYFLKDSIPFDFEDDYFECTGQIEYRWKENQATGIDSMFYYNPDGRLRQLYLVKDSIVKGRNGDSTISMIVGKDSIIYKDGRRMRLRFRK